MSFERITSRSGVCIMAVRSSHSDFKFDDLA
jgi:hypothetical protein